MRAIVPVEGGLHWQEVPTPTPGPGEIRIRVTATAVNRADLLQRAGAYRPPPGTTDILGLEAAGAIDAVGPGVDRLVGERVCALLAGGGYAEQVVCPAGHALPIPEGLDDIGAAAIVEVFATAWQNLFFRTPRPVGDPILIHAAASGVGTAAIQLCRAFGARTFVTAGSDDKIARCVALGAEGGANRHAGPWVDAVRAWAPDGVSCVLDPVGASYLGDNLAVLRTDGTLALIGLMGGRTASIDLGRVLVKRLTVRGSTLRSRSVAEKTALLTDLQHHTWPLFASGALVPIVHQALPITSAAEAHALLAGNDTVGKLVLEIPERT